MWFSHGFAMGGFMLAPGGWSDPLCWWTYLELLGLVEDKDGKINGNLMGFNGVSPSTMGFNGISPSTMGFNGISPSAMGFNGISTSTMGFNRISQ
jgi:uncharacterized membrane protein YtjA (UPF0391 family)